MGSNGEGDDVGVDPDSALGFTIGFREHDFLRLEVVRRSHDATHDFWDGNWLEAPLMAAVGGFAVEIPRSQLHGADLRVFRVALEQLHERLVGEARLWSMDGWFDVTITGDGSGRLDVVGMICDEPGLGNRLNFRIGDYDQTFLPALLDQLRTVETRYPLRGDPDGPLHG